MTGPESTPETPQTAGQAIRQGLQELVNNFKAFAGAPRALTGLYISYFFEGLAYFGVLTELMLYLMENVRLSEPDAGLMTAFLTGGITISQLFLGTVVDRIGVRRALWLALSILLGARLILASGDQLFAGGSTALLVLVFISLAMVAIAYGLYQPAAYAAVKQFTDEKSAAMAYAMIYGLMNLGAFAFGLVTPWIREASVEVMPPNGISAALWTCAAAVAIALLVAVTMMTRTAVRAATVSRKQDDGDGKPPATADPAQQPLWDVTFIACVVISVVSFVFLLDFILEYRLGALFNWARIGNKGVDLGLRLSAFLLLSSPALVLFLIRRPDHPFRNGRFVFFIFILIPVQTLFTYTWFIIPPYTRYAFTGWVSEKYELISNLNPLLIFVLAPIVAGLTARVSVYKMMFLGTLVMAAPTFLLAFGAHPVLLFSYLFLMTIGEAMWQPRFLQHIAEIAPEGKTGIYMGIGQFPWFVTKMISGLYAGHALQAWCPEAGERNTELMWLVFGCVAMITPVALWLMRNWAGKGEGMRSGLDQERG